MENLISEKQKAFMLRLGLQPDEKMTMQEASQLIDETKKAQKEERAKHDEQVAGTFVKPQPSGQPLKTEVNAEIKPVQTPKPYIKPTYSKPFYNSAGKQASIEKMHEDKTRRMIEEERLKIRSMSISFSKDLVVAGKIEFKDMENEAQKIIDFINKKESDNQNNV